LKDAPEKIGEDLRRKIADLQAEINQSLKK